MGRFREWVDKKYKDKPDEDWTIDDIAEFINKKDLSAIILMVNKPKKKNNNGPIDIVTVGFDDPVCPEVAAILGKSACIIDSITHGAPPGAIIN